MSRELRGVLLVTAVFAAACAVLIGWKPLTMDELIQVLVMRRTTALEILKNAPWSAGAAPLGYIAQHWSSAILGYSNWALRIPAAIFGVASVAAAGALALRLGVKGAWAAAALFAAFPLTLRYAVEARPYSQAMFLSILATILFLAIAARPRVSVALLYGIVLTAALYTQPLAALVAAGHLVWAAAYRRWAALQYAGVAALLAAAAFAPWIVWAHAEWTEEIAARGWSFGLSAKTPLMLFREFAGAGYWGSAMLAGLCCAYSGRLRSEVRSLLLLMIAAILVGGLAADALFHYFIASRQFLWALPAVAILAAPAADHTRARWLGFALLLICAVYSVKYFSRTDEDWPRAVKAITAETGRGACFRAAPSNARAMYAYYAPQLAEEPGDCEGVVTAIPAQTTAKDAGALRQELLDAGYSAGRAESAGGSSIQVWKKESTRKRSGTSR